jgi:hypothetical protein
LGLTFPIFNLIRLGVGTNKRSNCSLKYIDGSAVSSRNGKFYLRSKLSLLRTTWTGVLFMEATPAGDVKVE